MPRRLAAAGLALFCVVTGTSVHGLSIVRNPQLIYLDANDSGDAFRYDPVTGAWSREVSADGSGFVQQSQGSWSPGWSILRADFNTDALTDFFLYNKATGEWAKMLNDGTAFTTESTGVWATGWERYAMNLDGDGITDLFVHDPTTGIWFKCLSTPTGFSYIRGGWNPGWETYLTNFNGDGLDDLFLISRSTGRWFWALGDSGPGFTYPVTETWYRGWALYPGDFNGDALTDLLLHDPVGGTYFTALTGASGFTFQSGAWTLGWTPWTVDLNGDDRDDIFLHDSSTGAWSRMLSDGAGGFANAGGQVWSLGWRLYPTDLDFDGRDDLVLYDPQSGAWYQARSVSEGPFDYTAGVWEPGLSLGTRRSNRPECSAFVTFASTTFPAQGGSIEGHVITSEPDCAWSISESGSWLTVFPAAGTGSTKVTAIATTTFTADSAVVGIGAQQLSMTKAGEPNADQLGIAAIYCSQWEPNNGPPFYFCMVVPHFGQNPRSTGLDVMADLSPIGKSASQNMYYDQDGAWSMDIGVPEAFPSGLVMLNFLVTDDQGRVANGRAPLIVK